MDQSTFPEQSASSGQTPQDDLRLLRQDVEKLKSEKNSVFQRGAMYLGIVGGILGIATAGIALIGQIDDLRERPDTFVSSQELAVTYQPSDSTFAIQIPMVLDNKGAGDDIIKSADSKLIHSPGADLDKLLQQQTESLNAGVGQFTFLDAERTQSGSPANLSLPFYIGKKAARTIFLSILFDKDTFSKAGLNRLDVNLIPQKGSAKASSFCFYLDDIDIQELQKSEAGGRKRFLTSSCGGKDD